MSVQRYSPTNACMIKFAIFIMLTSGTDNHAERIVKNF